MSGKQSREIRLVIEWDGEHLPDALRQVPPGRYSLESVADPTLLSPAEEDGLQRALDELDAGEGRSLTQVILEIRQGAPRR